MPVIPEFLGGPNGWMGITATLILLVAFFWKPALRFWRLLKSLMQFAEDWNGTPERKDHSGMVIEPAKPGVPALLETVRSQVQNSHSTNLRDDVDGVIDAVSKLTRKVDEHIEIAIKSDNAQDQTAEQVKQLVEDVGKLTHQYIKD